MAAACTRPGRVAGYHFFNPVPVMKIVEVVDGVAHRAVGGRCAGGARQALWPHAGALQGHARLRRQPCRARLRARESLRVLQEGVADFATIDRILVDAAGFRMGPFGLLDLVGLDVAHARDEVHARAVLRRAEVPARLPRRAARRGRIARAQDRPRLVQLRQGRRSPRRFPSCRCPRAKAASVWCVPELKDLISKLGAKLDAKPAPDSVCFVAPLGKDATTTALELGLDPARTVAVDPLFGFAKRRTLMTTPVTKPEVRDAAHALLASDGVPVSVIRDSAGFVAQRVVAHIVNVGCDIVQQRIATPEDLDRAVMLGLGYPKGPLAMGDAIGAREDPRHSRGDARLLPRTALPAQPLAQAPGEARRFAADPGVIPCSTPTSTTESAPPSAGTPASSRRVRPDDLAGEVIAEVVEAQRRQAGGDQRRDPRLRQPGGRGLPQRRALRRADGRPAADHAGRRPSTACARAACRP